MLKLLFCFRSLFFSTVRCEQSNRLIFRIQSANEMVSVTFCKGHLKVKNLMTITCRIFIIFFIIILFSSLKLLRALSIVFWIVCVLINSNLLKCYIWLYKYWICCIVFIIEKCVFHKTVKTKQMLRILDGELNFRIAVVIK